MFTRIMAPVDLAHLGRLERALEVTTDLARHYDVPVTFVSITSNTPGPVAHTPAEFEKKLAAFVVEQAEGAGITAEAHAMVGHDPATDTDDLLLRAVKETGADLVVMASHKPGMAEYFWPSNGGKLAAHTGVSVMLVRDT